ncbi:MAG: phage integrase N-terminal SAM-like domain-containing protein [Betaproteobacteria bacterium]|nr:phage integrase N-terminal SAM-like domain-containing protein [Betaproteobacteria bacterium]
MLCKFYTKRPEEISETEPEAYFLHRRNVNHWSSNTMRIIVYSGRRHPRELGAPEVTAFLNHLAQERQVAAATQNQALAALLFLYKEVLAEPLPWLEGIEHAKRPTRRPTVLTEDEARRLLYGAGGRESGRGNSMSGSCRCGSHRRYTCSQPPSPPRNDSASYRRCGARR